MEHLAYYKIQEVLLRTEARGCHFDTLYDSQETQPKLKDFTVIEELYELKRTTEEDTKPKYSIGLHVGMNSGAQAAPFFNRLESCAHQALVANVSGGSCST